MSQWERDLKARNATVGMDFAHDPNYRAKKAAIEQGVDAQYLASQGQYANGVQSAYNQALAGRTGAAASTLNRDAAELAARSGIANRAMEGTSYARGNDLEYDLGLRDDMLEKARQDLRLYQGDQNYDILRRGSDRQDSVTELLNKAGLTDLAVANAALVGDQGAERAAALTGDETLGSLPEPGGAAARTLRDQQKEAATRSVLGNLSATDQARFAEGTPGLSSLKSAIDDLINQGLTGQALNEAAKEAALTEVALEGADIINPETRELMRKPVGQMYLGGKRNLFDRVAGPDGFSASDLFDLSGLGLLTGGVGRLYDNITTPEPLYDEAGNILGYTDEERAKLLTLMQQYPGLQQ
jgi:hypothetical protein